MCTCVHMLKASDFSIFLNSSSRQQGFPLRVTLENLIFSPKQPDCPRDCHKYLMNILATQIQRFTLCRIDSATIHYSEIAHILESNCVTRAPLLYFIRSWVALSFKCESVSESVRHVWHPSKSPLFARYKGMNVLYWPSIINYQLLPPHSVIYWPSTQLHHLVTHSWANWI